MGIDGSGRDARLDAPTRGRAETRGIDTVPSVIKRYEELEFERSEPDLYPSTHTRCAARSMRRFPNSMVGASLDVGTLRRSTAAHPEDQLPHAEWLRDVVIRAKLEADDAVDLLTPGGQHDHREGPRLRVVLDGTTHLGARDVRQHQVQDAPARGLSSRTKRSPSRPRAAADTS